MRCYRTFCIQFNVKIMKKNEKRPHVQSEPDLLPHINNNNHQYIFIK